MESLTYIISDQVDFSRLVSHRYPTNLFMSISWRAIPSAVRKQSVCSLGSDLADVCNSNRWNYTELLPLPVQALSCGYSRFYHQADALPSQQLSPSDPLGCVAPFHGFVTVTPSELFDSSPPYSCYFGITLTLHPTSLITSVRPLHVRLFILRAACVIDLGCF